MKQCRFIAAILCFIIFASPFVRAQDLDSEIAKLTDNLATKISNKHCKKVSVVDFTDLEGNSTEIGKYAADEMTVDLAMKDRDFAILDRAHLASIMAEHKLTSTGLVNPDNAKQLGELAGVDALIFGKVKQNGNKMGITVQVIATDTGEIIGAARTEIQTEQTNQIPSQPSTPNNGGAIRTDSNSRDEKPKFTKSFGDLQVEIQSLKIIEHGKYLLTMVFSNQSPNQSIWVALRADAPGVLTNDGGFQFMSDGYTSTGIGYGRQRLSLAGTVLGDDKRFNPSTEISAGDATPVTVTFQSRNGTAAQPGACDLQLEFFLGHGFNQNYVTVSIKNLMTKLMVQ
jgi:TolB-like protein